MDLKSPFPFWPIKNGLPETYPPLEQDETCDVVVLGAGITGALVAEELSRRGLNVVVLDRREVGQGSSAASTGLLQYEIDVPLFELIKKVGQEHAERAYRLCLNAIDQLEELSRRMTISSGFQRKLSLYGASKPRHVAMLRNEWEARKACGIDVQLYEGEDVQERFPLRNPALIVSSDAAVCDSYMMTHGILQLAIQQSARVYDRTEATRIRHLKGGITVATDRGPTVFAKKIVYATGYESQSDINVTRLISTYALVTQPLNDLSPWNSDWMYWETGLPYLYLRTTQDQRILAGGVDDPFRNPRLRDARIPVKTLRILQRLKEMFPDLPLEAEYSWAGTFAETEDGLAYIGPAPKRPQAYYALGFGGNGITFSIVAAQILADLITGIPNSDAAIFRFGR